MLQSINDGLVDRLAENVRQAMTQSLGPVSSSMDRFIIGATRNQIDGVNRIVGRFLDEMDRSLGNQFGALSSAMDAVTQNQIAAARETGETLASARDIVRNAQSLQEMTDHILVRFDAYLKEINAVRVRDEGFEKRSTELMHQMQQQNRELSGLLTSLTASIKALPAQDETHASLKEIQSSTAALTAQVKAISETLSALSEEV